MNTISLVNPLIFVKRRSISKWRVNLQLIWVFSFIVTVFLLILYIIQVNTMIRETYLIQGYQRKFGALSQENKTLEINFSQANSLFNITNAIKSLNFEKAEKIRYIQVLEGQVVTNQ